MNCKYFLLSILLLVLTKANAQMLRMHPGVPTPNDTTILTHADSMMLYFGPEPTHWQPINDSIRGMRSEIPFGVIFTPRRKRIIYTPTNFPQKWLDDYQNMLNAHSSKSMLNTSADPILDVKYQYTVDHPEKVQYTWRQIPDPNKDIREGRRIRKDKKQELSRVADMIKTENNDDSDLSMKSIPKEEPSPWKTTGQENLQISQLYLENWAKGGETSTSLISDFRATANYAKGKHTWENSVIHKMGFTNTSVLGTRVSNDELNLSSKYGFKAVNNWYYSFLNTFKTQLFRNYASSDKEKAKPKSTMLSPAYIQFIFGMDYKKDNLSVLLSPYTAIITVVVDTATIDQTSYSISENKRSNTVDGFSVTVNWKKPFTRDLIYTTKGEVFYEYFEKHGQKRLDWENVLDYQLNRFLAIRVILELRYYENESKKFQIKENVNFAFKYTF